jgi:SAM-dependent methyltransferase
MADETSTAASLLSGVVPEKAVDVRNVRMDGPRRPGLGQDAPQTAHLGELDAGSRMPMTAATPETTALPPVDEDKLNEFMGRILGDCGAAASAPLVVIGDKLGLYRAMADGQPVTATELAVRTGTAERYVREWLAGQAAGGYVTYDGPDTDTATATTGGGERRYHLEPEQAAVLADEDSPTCMLGAFEVFDAAVRIGPRLLEAFRSGGGIGWHEHDPALFRGTARFFRSGYAANLTSAWLPALDGVVDTLTAGGRVADVGCGYGHSTLLMAQAYPAARFVGYDYHPDSIAAARTLAVEAGLADRVSFEVSSATEFPGTGFDLIAFFDCLHDMGDPIGALTHSRGALAPDGVVLLVEPYAGDDVADNLNPVGRLYYAASNLICTPASLSQPGGAALGTQAGEAALRAVAAAAGFTRFRRAAETPFNLILEARP